MHKQTTRSDNEASTEVAGFQEKSPIGLNTYEHSLLNADEQKFLEDYEREDFSQQKSENVLEDTGNTLLIEELLIDQSPKDKSGENPNILEDEESEDNNELEETQNNELLFDSTSIDMDIPTEEEKRKQRITQHDLDELHDLDDLLMGEFDCFES